MKQERLNFYSIDMKYVRNLAKADDNVMSVSPQEHKQGRPFVGVIVMINNRQYCVPLTSPKPKFEKIKNSVDFLKIEHPTKTKDDGSHKIIGGLNFNNMLPVSEIYLHKIDVKITPKDNEKTKAYKELLRDQLAWCRSNDEKIIKKANNLYDLITKHADLNINLAKRCCKFQKLESILDKMIGKLDEKEEKIDNPNNQISPFRKMVESRLAAMNAPKKKSDVKSLENKKNR